MSKTKLMKMIEVGKRINKFPELKKENKMYAFTPEELQAAFDEFGKEQRHNCIIASELLTLPSGMKALNEHTVRDAPQPPTGIKL